MDKGEIDHFSEHHTTTASIPNIRSKESVRSQTNPQALHRTATFQRLIFSLPSNISGLASCFFRELIISNSEI
jgi:hypothetical protein